MDINMILNKELNDLSRDEASLITASLIERMLAEHKKNDRSGIYARTQTEMAYNSNKIEGSTLTPEQTESLFATGTIHSDGEIVYRAKDIEEMTGHFSMFNCMLKTWSEPLSEELIKRYHYHLKAGVFEDMANGYPVGEYKNRINMVSNIHTVRPDQVHVYMSELLSRYSTVKNVTLRTLARFHADFERIHPFQDGNGRTGRMLLFKECLKNGIIPVIIKDNDKESYYRALNRAQTTQELDELAGYFRKEQEQYYERIREFLWEYHIDNPQLQPPHSYVQNVQENFLQAGWSEFENDEKSEDFEEKENL